MSLCLQFPQVIIKIFLFLSFLALLVLTALFFFFMHALHDLFYFRIELMFVDFCLLEPFEAFLFLGVKLAICSEEVPAFILVFFA